MAIIRAEGIHAAIHGEGTELIACDRCGTTTPDPDLWDPDADTGLVFCDRCWPLRRDVNVISHARYRG